MTPEQRERLPKYARDELARLELRLREAEASLAAAYAGPADSDTMVDHWREPPQLLGKGTSILFKLGTQAWVDCRVDSDRYGPPVLVVHGSDKLRIEPHASNAITVAARTP